MSSISSPEVFVAALSALFSVFILSGSPWGSAFLGYAS